MEDKSYHELINECARDLCLQSDRCTLDCHKLNCETSWHAENLIRAGWIKLKIGNWVKAECSEKDGDATCSVCGHWDWSDCKHCSNCGAKMEGHAE